MTAGFVARAVLALATLALGGCGGGGDGGGGATGGGATGQPAPTPGGPATGGSSGGPLAFTVSNAGRVAGYPLATSASAMQVAQALVDELVAVAAEPVPSSTGNCSSGTWKRTLADNDRSGSLSAGDVVTVTFSACTRAPLVRTADGVAVMTVLGAGASGSVLARVSLPRPTGLGLSLAVGRSNQSDTILVGEMLIEAQRTDTRTSLIVGGGSSDEIAFTFPGWPYEAERMTAFRLEKTHLWDEARTVVDLRMKYACPELGGDFTVTTPSPLRAWLDTAPEPHTQQGWVQMLGARGDTVKLTVTGGGPTSDLGLTLDQGGDGTIDGSGGGNWIDVGMGSTFFFADYTPGGRGEVYGFEGNQFSLRRPQLIPGSVPVNTELRFQFTRPPAGTDAWRWRLVDRGRPLGSDPLVDVPVQAQLLGALVIVKPLQPLRYSRQYRLMLDTGVPVAFGQEVKAQTGGTLTIADGSVLEFSTPDYLNPLFNFLHPDRMLSPGRPGVLSALSPREGTPPITYEWSQVSGPALVIEQPTQKETAVRLAGAGSGIGAAVIRLTVRLADGTRESSDATLRTMHDATGAWVAVLRAKQPGGFGLEDATLWSGPAVGSLTAHMQGDRLRVSYAESAAPSIYYASWSVELSSGDGQPLRPGHYGNAWSAAALNRPPGVAGIEWTVRGPFAPWGSEFDIHELEVDASGRVTRPGVGLHRARHW